MLAELEIQLRLKEHQQARWNRLMVEGYYLRSVKLVGEPLRYAAGRLAGSWKGPMGSGKKEFARETLI